MRYFIITSEVSNKTNTEGFYLEDEMDDVLDKLDEVTNKLLGDDYHPYEDGAIGYYSESGDCVYLKERDVSSLNTI